MTRWIELDGVVNMRDLGGLPTRDGRTTREGRLIRSDNLQDLSEGDVRHLVEVLGVTDVVDLRSHVEHEVTGAGPLRISGLADPTGFLGGADYNTPAVGARMRAGGLTFDTLLEALEQRGVVQILSEPTLTTVTGQTASFRAGGEFAERVGATVRAQGPGAEDLADGDVVDVGGLEIGVLATPGHTADSASFALAADHALLTGDTVLGRGTTVPMMTASTTERSRPPSTSNWLSHTAYSSAVRRGSVAMRQRVRGVPSSLTSANLMLVFPASIASSIRPVLQIRKTSPASTSACAMQT